MQQTERVNTAVDVCLDITRDRCPMTYVRVRLALDRMTPGQVLLVMLQGEEPLGNVPRTVVEQGHELIGREAREDGVSRLWIRKR